MPGYSELVESLRKVYATGLTKSLSFRLQQLKALLRLCEEEEAALSQAVKEDLRKSTNEILLTEIEYVRNEIRGAIYNLKEWAKAQPTEKNLVLLMDDSFIYSEPFGVVLVMGAWNYPVQLCLGPLIGAISGGNCAILKPSEVSPATADVLASLIPKYLNTDCYRVVNGGIPETTALLKEKFDYIFFTGSSHVGKIVHQAAAKHLTPVTLEMGGKSPVYLDDSVNMDVACRRIIWGKLLSLGQTCVAPDYILCNEHVQELFIQSAKKVMSEFFDGDPIDSMHLGRIVSDKGFTRLKSYLTSGHIALGGKTRDDDRYVAITILTDVKEDDMVMQEEIFGPILPIMRVKNEEEAVDFINKGEKPLSLYLFSTKKSVIDKFVKETSSGSLCVNDTVIHLTIDALPFGGVGNSGMGCKYHGKGSFDAFSHKKSILVRNYNPVLEKISSARYPPFTEGKKNFLMAMLKKRPNYLPSCLPYILVFLLGVSAAVIGKVVIHVADLDDSLPEALQ